MSWKVIPAVDQGRVTAVFEGHLDAEAGAASAGEFKAAFGDEALDVVWDVTGMTGFDGAARSAWAEAVWPLRAQIKSLKVVGAQGMVRIGATFLALLLGKPYEFVPAGSTEP